MPYCRALCHYCDFAKTANFDDGVRTAYLARLVEHVAAWLERLGRPRLTSVFLGGGTPSLYTDAYEPLMALVRPLLAANAEVTLEANPDDVDARSVAVWRGLGFNRLSLGVQTFDAGGLKFMKRLHDAEGAARAIEAARGGFDDVNVDLIYGWHGQDLAGLLADVARAAELGAQHLSLYTLTYEPRTPIGRAALRGRIVPATDETLAAMYEGAGERLATLGFHQEEVSNWHRPGHACRHNAAYWRDEGFIGVGVGAHGYLADDGIGVRYRYLPDDRKFIRTGAPRGDAPTLSEAFDVVVEEGRDGEDWLTEYVGSALRSQYGVDMQRAAQRSGLRFKARPAIEQALQDGNLKMSAEGILTLAPGEWFRETAWCVELLRSFGR